MTLEYTYTFHKIGPRWWQLRARYYAWRFRRMIAREDARLDRLGIDRRVREDMAREIEHAFLFGTRDRHDSGGR